MARPNSTYRAARRKDWRKRKLIWRLGRETAGYAGSFVYGWHRSMPQSHGQPYPAKRT